MHRVSNVVGVAGLFTMILSYYRVDTRPWLIAIGTSKKADKCRMMPHKALFFMILYFKNIAGEIRALLFTAEKIC